MQVPTTYPHFDSQVIGPPGYSLHPSLRSRLKSSLHCGHLAIGSASSAWAEFCWVQENKKSNDLNITNYAYTNQYHKIRMIEPWLSHFTLPTSITVHSYWTHRMFKKDLNGAPLLERATLDGALKESPVVHNLQGNRTHLSLIFSLFRKWYVFTCVLDAHVRKHET